MLKALKKKRPKNKVRNKKIYQVNNLNSKEAKKDILDFKKADINGYKVKI